MVPGAFVLSFGGLRGLVKLFSFAFQVQFGHAGACANQASETAVAKNQALKEAGVFVPRSFDELGEIIQYVELVEDATSLSLSHSLPRTAPSPKYRCLICLDPLRCLRQLYGWCKILSFWLSFCFVSRSSSYAPFRLALKHF